MENTMPATQTFRSAIDRALDMKRLKIPNGIAVTKVFAEDYTDADGEPALRVSVILDEGVDVEKISGAAVGDLKFAIGENLRAEGIELFPYIFLAKPSELADTEEV
jgi:hypothetical protein